MSKLSVLGYYFDDEGVLKSLKDDQPFKFTNQQAYEELGEAVDEEVYRLLEDDCGLLKVPLKPLGKNDADEDLSFIFVSKNCKKRDKLLVLIHGSGVVRAGQWARRLIINDNLECGTQIPYVKRALALGWGVVVMNTNLNASQDQDLKYSRTPAEHAETAWKTWVQPSYSKKIYVVAHSRGGYDMACLLRKHGEDERIKVICLTDSPWFEFNSNCAKRENPLFVINFLANGSMSSPEYKVVDHRNGHVARLFAGTQKHEWSSHCAIHAVFHILESGMTLGNYKKIMEEAKLMVQKEKKKEEKEEEEDEPEAKKIRV